MALVGIALSANAVFAQIGADIQVGGGDKALKANTSLQVKAGDQLTVEIFATSHTSAQGVEVILEVSGLKEFVSVDGQGNYAEGS
jgi:allophanate hydrolase subunit 2